MASIPLKLEGLIDQIFSFPPVDGATKNRHFEWFFLNPEF